MSKLQCFLLLSALFVAQFDATRAVSAQNPSQLCDSAARAAANRTGVPVEVLFAITRTETGRKMNSAAGLQPWPWAVNEGGKGQWFDSAEQAMRYAQNQILRGVTNIDIGCFQLNHRWHAQGFTSLEAMFDPLQNALYAAHFLQSNYEKTGDWSAAAGAYHSGTPEYATRYRRKFDQIIAALPPYDAEYPTDMIFAEADLNDLTQPPRENAFPLLRSHGQGLRGSLVGAASGRGPLFGNN